MGAVVFSEFRKLRTVPRTGWIADRKASSVVRSQCPFGRKWADLRGFL
jgi:hypothetical protein